MFSFFALFESLGLPLLLVDKFWLIFLIFGSGVSMIFLCSVTVQKAHRLSKVVSGLAYMYSLYVVVNLDGLHPSAHFLYGLARYARIVYPKFEERF